VKSIRLRLLLASVLAAAIAGSIWWFYRGDGSASNFLVLHGNVDVRQVELAFNASERIVDVLVREGDRVKKGQLLARLDTGRLSHSVEQAKAEVAAQQQVVARLVAGARPEEINKARAEVEAAAVDARNARANYLRDRDLAKQHFISEQQADNARAAAEAAESRLNAVREALHLLEEGSRKEDIAAARATLAARQAALGIAQHNLDEATLSAPADGVIENRILEPGDMASPQKAVFTLALTDPLWVRAYVSELDLGKLRLGGIAEIGTDSHPDKPFRGWIGFISPTAEFTPKSVETREVRTALVYQVRVFVCAFEGGLRLGMPATVTIPVDQPPPAGGAAAPDPCKSGQ
jgi:multidrug resistance efflux pump